MTDPSTKARLNPYERKVIQEAEEMADRHWNYAVALGVREPRGSAEYMRRCLAPKLREMVSE